MEEQIQKLEKDVSVIVVNFNSTELLKDCLDSIIGFTDNINYEVIVVDNGSDKSDIEHFIKDFENILFIKNKVNRGFGGANNQGAAIAKGKYFLFLNNDTILFENTIKKVFDLAESVPGENIIGCKLLNEDKSIQKSVYDFPTLLNVFTSNFFLYLLFPGSKYFNRYHLMNKGIKEITGVDVVTGAFLFINRKSFETLNGFDERFFFYMEETDLCYRHKQNKGQIIYYPETSLIHLKGKSSSGESWFKNKYRSFATIYFFQKHFHGLKFCLAILFHHIGLLIRSPLFILFGVLSINKEMIRRGFYCFLLTFLYPSNQFKS